MVLRGCFKGLDIETFKTMWKLSEPGGNTEGMFMRLPQTEYYCHKRSSPDALELMPGVRSPLSLLYYLTRSGI